MEKILRIRLTGPVYGLLQVTLENEITSLTTQINASPPPANKKELEDKRNDKQTQLNGIQTQITDIKKTLEPKRSEGFIYDVLKDADNGISFHRFQMLVWTLVIGIVFVILVWSRLAMPDFGARLLALLGISISLM